MRDKLLLFFKQLVSGTFGLAGFIFSMAAYELGFFLSLLIGFLVYGGTAYALGASAHKALPDNSLSPYGLDTNYVQQTLREGQQKLRQIDRLRGKVKGWFIRRKVGQIHRLGCEILDVLHKDPKRVKLARTFFSHYLDSTITILEKYVYLSSKPVHDAEIRGALKKTEATLDQLKVAYEKELAQILSNDVLDLDVELEVFKKSMDQKNQKKP
ncbi:hypothetical protein F9B85_10945 [Heliorestis acidaminivorans]|uniref:5-bromo-4-chloroindolyl phosphate hydrolysis protein n=1 Tax=Heliorestis acidaminivorans TaxID=553427 RepID=A0A6I0F0Y7_9FIRM|nr:5-bromo-4-chloroindolyl phosphate hydrolysis family protein [Heliorestis acidaminivorans]KAB2951800.1 hypothetical protein F9B85_10945 [Heliorestis acidaminivorans]